MLHRFRHIALAALIAVSPAGPVLAQEALAGFEPAEINGQALSPGLAATYWRGNRFDLMLQMHDVVHRARGEPGEPVLQLDTGRSVLSTNSQELVAAVLKGLIHFEEAGTYQVEFVSNDGILVEIDGQMVHADPNRHSDSTSGPIPIQIDTPGWYDLDIAYFQKKGSHRHEMYWLPPSAEGDLDLVPAAAFAHLPGTTPGPETMPEPDPDDTFVR